MFHFICLFFLIIFAIRFLINIKQQYSRRNNRKSDPAYFSTKGINKNDCFKITYYNQFTLVANVKYLYSAEKINAVKGNY